MAAPPWPSSPVSWGGAPRGGPEAEDERGRPPAPVPAPGQQQRMQQPSVAIGGGPQAVGVPRPHSFEEWLSTSLQQGVHHYKMGLVTLARQGQVDMPRTALAW